ncbi:hypothetical protein ACRDU6_00370 (plasmid) [Mycolicibacterium sp. ELW1]|uniref:hypothetical protein n=1 Tax=Mycobacteriaceae TaxID=1762 RepID=UPI00143DA08C|nr:hypothetical protein [Mycobacterium sp. ELW1]
MSSCERALVEALTRPAHGPVPPSVVAWVVTGAWPQPAIAFDVAHPRPQWSGSLGL